MSKSAIFDGKPVNIPKFKDNQPGTIPLIEWKQQLEQHAQEDTNNVGVRVLWGLSCWLLVVDCWGYLYDSMHWAADR